MIYKGLLSRKGRRFIMSNRLFQGLLHQMHDTMDCVIGVVDETATVIACSDLSKIGATNEFVSLDLNNEAQDIFVRDGYTYKPFGTHVKPEYAVFVEGIDENAARYANILAITLSSIKQYYDEKYDRNNFIKNVVLDNILPGDIVIKARELHFNSDITRVVLLIRIVSTNDVSAYDVIQNLFPDKSKDFVFNITESDIVLVKEVKPNIETKDLEKLARSIADTLSSEFYTRVNVGIGTCVQSIKELARSFKEAQIALEVGKVFDTDKIIVSYDNLGIARLIYHLPTTLCETFLHEVFKKGSIESLDHETLFTIQRFFENNLNVSETSRKLFVHRNTLVYRLEKIKKLTGLDLREFDHAIVFKIALMVKKYLSANPTKF
ncbi:MAG: Carbohydrate diacid regulator [Oscillospiraceae bacterium]|nr:Carbohydrate diacid regulator [Oscillospiraceae bacterium]